MLVGVLPVTDMPSQPNASADQPDRRFAGYNSAIQHDKQFRAAAGNFSGTRQRFLPPGRGSSGRILHELVLGVDLFRVCDASVESRQPPGGS